MINRTDPKEIHANIVDRDIARAISALLERVNYISDPDHDNHQGKEVKPAHNSNCPDQTKEAFIAEAERMHAAYQGRGQGNRTKRFFDEIIYSSDQGAALTDEERKFIETRLINDLCPDAAVRTAWHVDHKTGRSDLHILFSATDRNLKAVFGRAVGNSIMAFQRLDREIVAMLNTNPARENNQQKAAIDVHADEVRTKYLTSKPATIGEQIARKLPGKVITADNLGDALAKLGHKLVQMNATTAFITFKQTFSVRPIPLRELLLQIGEAQVAILKRIRAKKLAMLAKQIAKKTRQEVSTDNLLRVLKTLGHVVEQITPESVRVLVKDSDQIQTYSLRKLLVAIHEAQHAKPPTTEQPTTTEEPTTTGEPATTREPANTREPATREPTITEEPATAIPATKKTTTKDPQPPPLEI